MKKFLLGTFCIIISVVSLFYIKNYILNNSDDIAHVSAAIFGSDSSFNIPTETVEKKGTASNPFVVLEIVPYEGYAEVGYMIKGCEPVPMDKVEFSSDDGGAVASTKGMSCTWEPQYTFDLPTGDKVGTTPGDWENIGNATQYGYYQKVEAGKGTFKQLVSGKTITFVETTAGDGNYIWIPFTINQPDPTKTTDYNADQVYTSRVRTQYRRYHNAITYYNKFLINTLGVPAEKVDDYKIQVVTITPKELNQADKQAWIDRADLIYIAPKSHFTDGKLTQLWEKYHTKISNAPTGFENNDFTWETTVRLLRKAASKDYAPIVFDIRVFTEDNSYNNTSGRTNITPKKKYSTGKSVNTDIDLSSKGYITNVAKLYMIMQQMEPAKFIRDYIDTGKVISIKMRKSNGSTYTNGSIDMTTGYCKEQDTGKYSDSYYKLGTADPASVWSIYTLLPYDLFADYNALDGGECWNTIGIDNYRVIVDGGASNVSVRHGFYSYNGDNSTTMDLTNEYKISLNQYSKEAFDYYHKTSGMLSPAMAIQFLLDLGRPVYEKNLIRILEIEPCNDFIWNGSAAAWNVNSSDSNTAYARQYFTKFFPNFSGMVSITKMTSSEFIGKIDDLNSNYDMIFFGLQDGALRKSGTTTVYNDDASDGTSTNLNGRIYLHNGDIIRGVKTKLRGLPGTNDTDTYRFSGNDITLLKLTQLQKFMQGGNPIILDTGFYSNSNRSSVNSGTGGAIDPNSYINDLAELDNSQLIYADGMITDQLESLLSASKCHIVFGKIDDDSVLASSCYPVVYKDRTLPEFAGLSDSQIDSKIFINGATDPNFRTLQYKFYINDHNASDSYQAKLFIDINADGKFDERTENVSGLNILNDKGYKIHWDELKAGVNYTVTRTLEADYYGILPWKLVITSNTNQNVYDTAMNYCALKSQNRIKLNILQIKSDTNNTVDLSTDYPERQPVFQKYLSGLKDYDVKITSMTVSEFSKLCGTGGYQYLLSDDDDNSGKIKDKSKVINRIDDDGDGIYDFDMLILGFADMYSDVSNTNELQNFYDFIEEGRTVLFTHDTTSFVNTPKSSYSDSDFWGYGLNKYFRDIFGMDRFGATLGSSAERNTAKKDYASNKSDFSGYIQGYSNMILNRYAPSVYKYETQYASNNAITLGDSDFENKFKTNYVSNVNKGQLTTYPYQIDDDFQVATTHPQYYQLDMEDDDIVVWYCLSDNGGGYYSTAPNDVRNNYYIYNKGNITYSGVGHSALNSNLSDTTHHTEVKLFVNTIIAAYTATAKQSQIVITNPDKSVDSNGKEYVYVDYDIYNTQKAVGSDVLGSDSQYQRIRYRVSDDNILFNKVLTVKYYYVDPVTKEDGTITTKLTPITDLTTKRLRDSVVAASSAKGDIIDSGEEYYFDLPLSELNNSNSGRTIMIQVETTYGKASDKTLLTEKSFTLVRRGLFDLD